LLQRESCGIDSGIADAFAASTGSEGFRRAIRFSGLGRQDDRFADGRKIERAPQRADDLRRRASP
jgi:hypothetical protein